MEFFSRVVAFLFILILFPIFMFICLSCILFQGFPIFFNQKRVGYNFKTFNIYQFRTMVNNNGQLITEPNDNRITLFGKFLRFTKIDEIPQLINNAGIGTSVHYKPVHMHSYYQKKYGFKSTDFPISYKLYNNAITLPLYPSLKNEQMSYITDILIKLWNKYKS